MPHLQKITRCMMTMLFVLVTMASWSASEVMAGGFHQTRWQNYDLLVRQISSRHHIDPRLVHAVIWQESNYNSKAVSSAGARGLMQLMPGTARDLKVMNSFSSQENIDGGTRYLITQLHRFGSVKRALQAYHGGPERVAKGRVLPISRHYSNQVIARYRHIRLSLPWTQKTSPALVAWGRK